MILNNEIKVIGLGCACLDFLAVVPYMPETDDEIRMSSSTQQGGGEVATALVTLSKLGTSTRYLGKVGDDPAGKMILEELKCYGVDIGYTVIDPRVNSISSVVIIDEKTGKRTILAGDLKQCEIGPADIPDELFDGVKFLHLDGTSIAAALKAAAKAWSAGLKIVLDADVLALNDQIDQLMALSDIIIASEGFARQFTGRSEAREMLDGLTHYHTGITAVTLGDRGSLCKVDDRMFHTPAFPVNVKDTTGAGDVFHGAFIYGLLQDWEAEKTAEFAAGVAAMKCREIGGRSGIPDLSQAITFLKENRAEHF